jgi:hypothetical protein
MRRERCLINHSSVQITVVIVYKRVYVQHLLFFQTQHWASHLATYPYQRAVVTPSCDYWRQTNPSGFPTNQFNIYEG